MRQLLVAVLCLSFCTLAGAEVAPDSLTCYFPGHVTSALISSAEASDGGMLYEMQSGETWLTTQPCIANLGAARKPAASLSKVSAGMTCLYGSSTIYHAGVVDPVLSQGVWTWTESDTGDQYVATATCTVGVAIAP